MVTQTSFMGVNLLTLPQAELTFVLTVLQVISKHQQSTASDIAIYNLIARKISMVT